MNEVAVLSKHEVVAGGNPNQLISLALEKQADPKIIEKLMDLHERWEAGQARKEYVAAMTAFKQEAPAVLKKNDRVDFTTAKGRTAYNYANLGSIVQEISAILGKHNLSASWMTAQEGSNVTVTCHITHGAGHRESVTLTGPIDESGNKNRIQAVGSTVTYLQRYTLLAALGLATGEDDDGRGGIPHDRPPVQTPQKTAPARPQAENAPPAEGGIVTGTIEAIEAKNGQTKGKDWTRYDITIDGVRYSTFSDTLADIASGAKEANQKVSLHYAAGPRGNTVRNLIVDEEPEPGSDG